MKKIICDFCKKEVDELKYTMTFRWWEDDYTFKSVHEEYCSLYCCFSSIKKRRDSIKDNEIKIDSIPIESKNIDEFLELIKV